MEKITSKLFFLFVLSFATNAMLGQNRPIQKLTPSGHIRCYTVENEDALRAKYPNRETTEQFEAWLAPQIERIKAERASGKNIQAVYNIPVVIHIVHDGDCLGTGENITDAQAISQITVMNQDYRKMAATPGGANSTGLAVDCEINFVLAKRDPAGNPSTGVVRHQITPYANAVADGAGGPDWETNSDVETMKAATIWDPTKYLNMWTIRPGGNSIATGGLQGLLGYAQFPSGSGLAGIPAGASGANTDGVVAAYDAMGTIAANDGTFILNATYNLGRTMTHEVGHWLGLRHIWGDNATCTNTAGTDAGKDYCPDTPAANAEHYDCAVYNTCTAAPGNDMVQNYMDYSNDACMDTFTANQKTRMQTVMAAATRRSTLNASNGSLAPSAGIYFNKGVNKCSVAEGTNCSYTDVTYPVSIIKAPTANAVVTFTVNGSSTATNNIDFQIMTPTVTFTSGSATSQNLIVRYFNDGIAESSENVVLGMTVNAGAGDGAIIAGADTASLTVSIIDNDVPPSPTSLATVFSENFDPAVAPRTLTDRDGDTKNWGLFASSAATVGWGVSGIWAGSRSWDSSGPLLPDNLLTFTNPIAIPTGASSLSYRVGANDGTYFAENYSVYLTTSNVPNTIVAQTPVFTETLSAGGTTYVNTVDISSFAGQSVYLSFRHHACTDQNILVLDDIAIKNTVATSVQVAVDTATPYQAFLNANGTAYSKDATTGKMIADITSTTNFDYGCTSVAVSRDQTSAGAAAVNYGSNTANNLKVMAKTVTVTPTTNNAVGAGSFKFYFSEAEIAAWEAATGNLRSALRIFKGGATTTIPATIGAFGPNVTLAGNVSNGITGVYYFGVDATLATADFEFTNFSLYPNPNNGVFNVKFTSTTSNDIKVNVHDIRGRQVYEKSFSNNGAFNQNINLGKVQAGVYIVSVIDGDQKTVKRIVVK
ncbi:MAG: T9SS type A sorting domain-containing protein [Flavobacterium sp.]|uniref:T9SS-dependent choice-of-anchor J family protein n=1 Tax=Flavobacterium sp. TaxID=239 RepID=UPI003263DF3D